MKGEGFFPDFDPIFGLKVDHKAAGMKGVPTLKLGPSCNDRIGPVATMFLVEWWRAVGGYPLVLHLVPRSVKAWRERLGNPPKSVDRYSHNSNGPEEIWLNVPEFSARSDETRRARIAAFASTVDVEASSDHALAEPDDFTIWQLTSTLARDLFGKTDYGTKGRFPVYRKRMSTADMLLGLPLRNGRGWAYCKETSGSPASTTAMRSIVYAAQREVENTINTAALAHQDAAHFEIDLRQAKEALNTYDRLRDMALTPHKLAWAAVERFRKFRGNTDAIDAEAFMLASAHDQIEWLQHEA